MNKYLHLARKKTYVLQHESNGETIIVDAIKTDPKGLEMEVG